MVNASTASSIDEYIAEFPPETRKVLEELRTLIRETAPGVTEKISYGMPTFDLNGRYLVYFAGWKQHIGLYPVTAGVAEAFREELKAYKSGKGSVRFSLGHPMRAPPDHHPDLTLELHLVRHRWQDNGAARRQEGARRLEEDQRFPGHLIAQFLGMIRIVAADADDLRRLHNQGHTGAPMP